MNFKRKISNLKNAVTTIVKKDIDISKEIEKKPITDYKQKKIEYYINSFNTSFKQIIESIPELNSLSSKDPQNQVIIKKIIEHINELDKNNIDNIIENLEKIETLYNQISPIKEASREIKPPKNLPNDIKDEIIADIKELDHCFNSNCLRSSVMLCGRILEIALFRKYYDATGVDLLEKAPGTGLGNLIAKLRDKNVELDPALTNQVHLINQIRIVTVHKKKQLWTPSKTQTHAIILYTLDTLEKLF